MDKSIWPRPVIIPEPIYVSEVNQPQISLSGIWKFCLNPVGNFWDKQETQNNWKDIPVPSTLSSLGIRPRNHEEYAYKTTICLPADYADKKVILRFSAVNCQARVWLDGQFIRSHWGGYNTWDADITDFVSTGTAHELTVGVTDRLGVMSQFHYGGIIRDVHLIAVPLCHFCRFHVLPDLDKYYKNGNMKVYIKLAGIPENEKPYVALQLLDPSGKPVTIEQSTLTIDWKEAQKLSIPVKTPHKWDAEHPHLYLLRADLYIGARLIETVQRPFGFRKIERKDDQVFINGYETKLRGVNREEVHPLTGRTLSREDIEKDVRLLKEANVNFVRTSHYNPSQYFLDLCDRYGLYVEEETSVSFVGQGQQFTSDDPEYLPHYMGQFAEMIEMDLSRPSIIIWSLGNESIWGSNLRAQLEYVKREDPSRLTIFSYPITMKPYEMQTDIWSAHYAEWYNAKNLMTDNNKSASTAILQSMGPVHHPVLHDEYVHVPCYNHLALAQEQGVRDFWGESIDRFWQDIFDTKGALGGAIWSGIDEVWFCPDHPDEIYAWGIIDGFRRKKPEHWHTRRAYSPIRITVTELGLPENRELSIPIQNRYDHTNLQELTVLCQIEDTLFQFQGPDIAPHGCGILLLPQRDWLESDIVTLTFKEPNGNICDTYQIPLVRKKTESPDRYFQSDQLPCNRLLCNQLSVNETDTSILITGNRFTYSVCKKTGFFSLFSLGQKVIECGASIYLDRDFFQEWGCSCVRYTFDNSTVQITVQGTAVFTEVEYKLIINCAGMIKIAFKVSKFTGIEPPRQKMDYGIDVGGYREIGLSLYLSDFLDRIQWDKDSRLGIYPEDHIGREKGIARKFRNDIYDNDTYRSTPCWPWKDDMADYALFGKHDHGIHATRDFTSMKSSIYSASVFNSKNGIGVEVLSDASDSVRLEWTPDGSSIINDDDFRVHYKGQWMRRMDPGCFQQSEMRSNHAGDSVETEFEGTGISWIAKQDMTCGTAQVYIDGLLMEENLSLIPRGGTGLKQGSQALYGEAVYTITNLPFARHRLTIKVTGRNADYWGSPSFNSYVSIDRFLLHGVPQNGKLKLIINKAFNYPDLAWGNYVKEPLRISDYQEGSVFLRPYEQKV